MNGKPGETQAERKAFHAVLMPHRSLGPTGFLVLMAASTGIAFVTGMIFLLAGAWPVLGFLGLDVLLIYAAFKLNYRSGRLYETVDLTAANGSRVQSIELRDRTPVRDRDTYTIAGCRRPFDPEGVLCSHAGFTNVGDLTRPDGRVWTNVEILRDGLERATRLDPARALTDISDTPLWPDAPFVQPLTGAGP